ncbi:MAG: serine/threonine protein kinase, partial [Planctomycetes bacterium]|nr:serine/threonine protein kinase [Planctomycetota bacterium]
IALKLAAIDSADPVRAERLWELQRGEVTMARRVAHPHVARVFDLGRHDGIPYLTMAYVPGPTLRGALRAGALTTLDIARLGHDIASALAAAHAAGVLHLDLKPENVVLTGGATPVAVLVDFGIARALGTASSGMGTADYISPEQLERSSLTGAADVFALGCVLHEALSGRHAFTGRSRRERMLARLDADPRALPDDVPAGLAALVRRCLAREPGERPTAAFLERAFAEQGLALDPQSGPSPTSGTSGTLGTSGTSARRVDLGAFGGGLGRRLATARRKLLRMGGEDESLAEIESVLAVEPRLDVGLALRALALVRLWHRSGVHTDAERHALAERAAAAVADAVAAASHLADTHLADALIADYGGDIAYAVRALRRAQTLEPLHAFSHEVLGRIELEGNVGGVDRLLLAHDLDAGQLGALATAAREHFLTGRDDEGEALLAVVEAGQHGRHLDATALRMRLCLWRRDRAQARRLQLLVGPPGLVALRVLQAGLGVLIGETSVDALIEAAADAAQRTASPKRKSHIHQLAAEALAAVAPDEA